MSRAGDDATAGRHFSAVSPEEPRQRFNTARARRVRHSGSRFSSKTAYLGCMERRIRCQDSALSITQWTDLSPYPPLLLTCPGPGSFEVGWQMLNGRHVLGVAGRRLSEAKDADSA